VVVTAANVADVTQGRKREEYKGRAALLQVARAGLPTRKYGTAGGFELSAIVIQYHPNVEILLTKI